MSDPNATKDDQTPISTGTPVAGTPVYAEELVAEKHTEQVGTVHVHKDVVEEPQTVTAEVTHDEMKVERTPINQEVSNPSTDAFQQADIEIPLQAETLTADKRVVQTEEVTLEKQQVTEQAQVTGTVRREQVAVDAPVAAAPTVSEPVSPDLASTSGTVEDSSLTMEQSPSVPTSSGEAAILSDGEERSVQTSVVTGTVPVASGAQANVTAPVSPSIDEMDSGTPDISPETAAVSVSTSTAAAIDNSAMTAAATMPDASVQGANVTTAPATTLGTSSAQSGSDPTAWEDGPEETILIRAGTPTGEEPASDRVEFVAGEDETKDRGSTSSASSGPSDAANKAKGVAQTIGSEVAGAASTIGDRIGETLGKLTGHE